MAILIKLKSSKKHEDMEKDANKALKQIEEKNYRNSEGLPNIRTLREFTSVHMSKGDTWSSMVRIGG